MNFISSKPGKATPICPQHRRATKAQQRLARRKWAFDYMMAPTHYQGAGRFQSGYHRPGSQNLRKH